MDCTLIFFFFFDKSIFSVFKKLRSRTSHPRRTLRCPSDNGTSRQQILDLSATNPAGRKIFLRYTCASLHSCQITERMDCMKLERSKESHAWRREKQKAGVSKRRSFSPRKRFTQFDNCSNYLPGETGIKTTTLDLRYLIMHISGTLFKSKFRICITMKDGAHIEPLYLLPFSMSPTLNKSPFCVLHCHLSE